MISGAAPEMLSLRKSMSGILPYDIKRKRREAVIGSEPEGARQARPALLHRADQPEQGGIVRHGGVLRRRLGAAIGMGMEMRNQPLVAAALAQATQQRDMGGGIEFEFLFRRGGDIGAFHDFR